MTTTRHLVIDLAATSRNWAISRESADRIRAAVPDGWDVRVVEALTSSDGDGPVGASFEARDAIGDAEVYYGFGITPDLMKLATKLRWVHSAAAGVANVLNSGIKDTDIVVTNSAGVHGPPIAESVVAGVLHFFRGFDVVVDQQRQNLWDKSFFVGLESPIREVGGARVLIVGAGGIGSETAQRLTALGATCIGLRRRPELGIPAGFAAVAGLDALDVELPLADIVVLSAPLTPETSELMTRARLATLKRSAIVINVSRGALLDENALADMIEAKQLRGAMLDVFREEPLASTSRLWQLRSVLVIPHVSPVSPQCFWPRQLDLFLDNWQRYVKGEPLRNVVDKQAGY